MVNTCLVIMSLLLEHCLSCHSEEAVWHPPPKKGWQGWGTDGMEWGTALVSMCVRRLDGSKWWGGWGHIVLAMV